MDETGKKRWESKYRQLLDEESGIYVKHDISDNVSIRARRSLGNIIQAWISVYENFWQRTRHSNPEMEIATAKNEITSITRKEIQRINLCLGQLWANQSERLQDLKILGEKLNSTGEVQLDKAIEILDNLSAQSRFALEEESKVRRERFVEILVSGILSLVFGGAIALFSVWVTNRSNMEKLDPYLDISLGEQNEIGLIPVSSDTLHLLIKNSGPADVENIQVSLASFHGSLNLDKIIQDYLQTIPNYSRKKLKKGDSVDMVFGNNDSFRWSNIFANEESVYKKDSRYKGLILFVKLHASYRRAVDKKIFHTTQVFIANRNSIVPIQAMATRDDFLPGYMR